MTFTRWMANVDLELMELCSMTSNDLPDFNYRDYYDAGADPLEAATDALENVA